MKKAIVISLCLLIAVGICGIGFFVKMNSPTFEFISMAAHSDDYYIEVVSSCSTGPESKRLKAAMSELIEKNNETVIKFHENYRDGVYVKPINIKAKIEVINKTTTITYYGTATLKDGTTEKINESFTINYVFTKKIPDVFKGETA